MKRIINTIKQELLEVTPPPSTRTYKTISHGTIIDHIEEELSKVGFGITEEIYRATHGSEVMQGHIRLNIGSDNDLKFEIAFLNSYDKTRRAVVVAGSCVRICENGHILGDNSYGSFKRKHTGNANMDIIPFIKEMIERASSCFDKLIRQKDRMKIIDVGNIERNDLIGNLYFDEGIISNTQMSVLKDEIKKPSFDYNSDPNSLWSIYNNITCALKTTHPSKWIHNHQKLNEIVNNKFSLT